NWYRIRVFGDDRHRDYLPRAETCIGKDIRRSYWFYAKVGMAGDGSTVTQYICDDHHSSLPSISALLLLHRRFRRRFPLLVKLGVAEWRPSFLVSQNK